MKLWWLSFPWYHLVAQNSPVADIVLGRFGGDWWRMLGAELLHENICPFSVNRYDY